MILNQAAVAALNLDDKSLKDNRDHIFRDDDLHGFGIRVRFDSGGRLTKTWCVQYRIEGKQRRQNIGKFPRMNAATARTKAGAWLNKVHEGTDPAGEHEAQVKAEALKFHKAVAQYLELKQLKVRDSTFGLSKLYLTGRYFEPLHHKSLVRVTRSDVASCLNTLLVAAGGKTATAQQAQKALMAFYTWAIRQGHCNENPVAKTEQIKGGPSRERVLSEDEIRTVWNALQGDDLGRIVKLLLLTGCRADEVGGLRWSEIDPEQGTLTLPPERTKNKRTHTLTLPLLALDIIRSVERHDGRDFLFGKWADGYTSWAKQKTLIEPLGLAHWTIHDLRRTAATHMAEIGIEPHIIEAVLNHVSGHKGGIKGVYNRASYAPQMKMALARWADHIDSIVTGSERKIVPLRP
jgi:integrase